MIKRKVNTLLALMASVIEIGVLGYKLNERKVFQIRVVNFTCLSLIISNSILELTVNSNLPYSFYFTLLHFSLLTFSLYLNYKTRYRLAFNVCVWSSAIILSLYTIVYGYTMASEYYLFGFFAGIFVVLDSFFYAMGSAVVCVFVFILSKWYQFSYSPLIKIEYSAVRYFVNIIVSFAVPGTVFFFIKRKSNENYLRVLKQKKEIEQQAKLLNQVNASKNRVFAIVSHDLRGPMASIHSFLQLVKEGEVKGETIVTYADNMEARVANVIKMMDELLIWSSSQIDEFKTAPHKIPLRSLIDRKVLELENQIVQKKINIINNIGDSVKVYADLNQLKIVTRNLLTNAIKFTAENGVVQMSAQNKQGIVEIALSDSGIGMNKNEIEQVFFARHKRSKKGTDGEKGFGIGLAICKELIENNGGTIKVESEPGTGTVFYISLPG